jgi:hypothetical protein
MKTTGLFVESGGVLAAISAWAWWRTTETFLEYLRDFRKWAPKK